MSKKTPLSGSWNIFTIPGSRLFLTILGSLFITTVLSLTAFAQLSTNFESFSTGTVHNQNGWSSLGSAGSGCAVYDHAVSDNSLFTGIPGSFGARSLRLSNAVSSGCFSDFTFSSSLYSEGGEATAQNAGLSGGPRQSAWSAEWDFISATPSTYQPNLAVTANPDRGDGARMSYVQMRDTAGGIEVLFIDYQSNAVEAGCPTGANFITTIVASGLNRSVSHRLRIEMNFVNGLNNDVVRIFVDGALVHTGKSWEGYYDQCEGNPSRTVDSILFRQGTGTSAGITSPAPGNAGNGFLIDNMTLSSGPAATTVTVGESLPSINPSAWFWYNDENDTIDNSLGAMVVGPGTPPLGNGSAEASVSGTQRKNWATYQFSGTPLASISQMKFSTYNPSAGNGGSPNRSGYLHFNVDFNGSDTWQRRLVFLPTDNGTVVQNTWKEWNTVSSSTLWRYSGPTWPAGTGEPGTTPGNTPKTWSQILTTYPGVRMRVTDSFLGIRVGEPYNDGYTEDIDAFKFGTTTGLTHFNFDPAPPVTYVDDSWAGTTAGSDPDGAGPATNFGYDAFATVQGGIDGVITGGTVNVAAGTYNENVVLNKDGLIVSGAGPTGTTIRGPIGVSGAANVVQVTANNVELRGFTITRAGNNTTDWNNPNLSSAGIGIIGTALTGMNVHDNFITGVRSGMDINNTSGHTIRNNVIDFNHTGVIFRNQTNNITFVENQVTNNRTVGVLFLDASGGTNSPLQQALNSTFFNNNISGNWYGEIVDRQSGGSLPAPGTTNLKNFSGNWIGSATPVVTTANSAEPGYVSHIPVAYGGTASDPGGQPDIAGPGSANFDYSPYLASGGDTNVQTTPGRGTYGFQGNFSSLNVSATSAQTGATSKIQEAIDLMSAGGTLTVPTGTYPGNVNVNKAITLKGTFTISPGTLTVSNAGAVLSPGTSPGIINSGDLSLTSGSTVNIELNGTTVGTQYDQLNVTGTVSLGNANLNVTTGFTPTAGTTFTIVNNDGSDAVTGTFNGLADGQVFFVGPNSFRIDYDGGTNNNDVVLTAVSLCNAVSIPTTITTLTGVSVNVPVNVDNTTGNGLFSTDFTLTYNPSVLSAPAVSLGTVTAGSTLTTNTSTPGVIVVSIFNSAPFSGAGTLANVSFTASGAPGTSSAVNFSSFKFNEGTPCISTSNGLVSIISGTITGTVSYGNVIGGPPAPRHVPNVTLNAAGSTPVSATTNSGGAYSLSGMGAGSYTVTPSKTGGDFSGISGLDSALIAQFVVGLTSLNATQQTVADVSGTGGITSFDAALIARYVAALPNFGQTGAWRFTPVNIVYPNVNTNISGQDYTALLMGDVTGNWFDPSATRMLPIVHKGRPIRVTLPDTSVAQGSELVVPVSITDSTGKGILSYEFELVYDPSVLEAAQSVTDTVQTLSDGRSVTVNTTTPGVIRVVVFGATTIEGQGALLNLRFNAIGAAGSTSALTWQNFNFNEGEVYFDTTNGQVQVRSANSEEASISGRLLTALGQGVPNTRITLTDSTGASRSILSNGMGLFQFGNVRVGETYTISVTSRMHTFTPVTVSVSGNAANVDIIAEP